MLYTKWRYFMPQPNDRKSLSYLYNANKPWMTSQGVVVSDMEIPESYYKDTNEWYYFAQVNPWTADTTEVTNDLTNSTGLNDTVVMDVATAQAFVDDNTDNTKLIKESTWVYYYEYTNDEGETVKKYINVT